MPDLTASPSLYEFINLYFRSFISFICAGLIFTAFDKWPNLKCVRQCCWWHNSSVRTDIFYVILTPVFKIYLRFLPVALVFMPMLIFMKPMQIYIYLVNGYGPLGNLSPFVQCAFFVLITDFLSYWSHRIFHKKYLWPLHAIHHGPHDVDWTTAYRFHPLNLVFGPWLIASILIMMGISSANIIPAALLETIMAYFVHSNLNITLGPLKYFVATPVFHRWHHTYAVDGGTSNYGSIFSLWDVVFGTFHFPQNCLPTIYGIQDNDIEENYIFQLIYPFKKWYWEIQRALTRKRQ
jgi:sterol desaturase/sphingolipid hydroxylase (fatty acid hydroxylase superfamily)